MIKDGGQRIATAGGAMLADPNSLGNLSGVATPGVTLEDLFDPIFWAARGQLVDVTGGRGAAWFIADSERWALRHYRRGGFVARLLKDRYAWAGEKRVRAFAEWRLLEELARRGLPVPKPIAARYERTGFLYRCDLITERIPNARPLSAVLSLAPLQESTWRDVGAAVARLHAAGVDHADLNAHNILLDGGGAVSVIDFDRGRLRTPGAWAAGNLSRLRRSLIKISRDFPAGRFSAAVWEWLLAGYASAPVRGFVK
ncbi:MAG TPA: 3-deoxy-D-manno-octulosonic acid kinase [Steroidobacteraceae bacterium]|nr:3-deoxy-D-manno-octulosonic acid kinase [Steroidobacteraceae bacterium]